jgi:hypothetical protein
MSRYFDSITAQDECDVIFNDKAADIEASDKLRLQVFIPKSYAPWKQRVTEFARRYFPKLKPTDSVVLYSKPGCKQQTFHADYVPTPKLLALPLEYVPMGLIYAFQEGTKLVVRPGVFGDNLDELIEPITVYLNPGDVLVFRPDLVHAGAGYDYANKRVHAFLDSPRFKRPDNQTYLLEYDEDDDEDDDSDEVQILGITKK